MPVRDLLFSASGASGPSDPNFENVTLLLSGDGTNGAQNNTFLDSSTNNFTITRNGNTTQGSFSPYGSNWSNFFDGSGDFFLLADNAAWTTSSAYTIECWYNPSVISASFGSLMAYSAPTASAWILYVNTDGTILFRWYNTSVTEFNLNSSAAISVGTWNHIAVTISGTTATIWINGVSSGTTTLSGSPRAITSGQLGIGAWGAVGSGLPTANGYISNARIVKGTAVYSGSTITVPTAPLTAITNTVLLTCQSNRFIDNSTNNFTLTVNGTPSVQRFSPFNPTAPYSTSVIGGSGYFDGSGDYLSVPNNSALDLSGDFTIDCWYYGSTLSGEQCIFHNYNADQRGVSFHVNGIYPRILAGNGSWFVVLDSSIGISANTWNYIAATRSGSTWTIWVNGVSGGTASSASTPSFTTDPATIGRFTSGTPLALGGYLSDLRVVKGTALTITVPTAPLSAVSGTSLLTKYQNAGIPDLAMQNNLETAGNAQVSTSVVKYGTGSLAFDGTADRIVTNAPNQALAFGTRDFTFECWIYPTSYKANNAQLGFIQTSSTAGGLQTTYTSGIHIAWGNSPYPFEPNIGGTTITNSSNVVLNTWTHVALVRQNGTGRFYVNGVQVGSGSATANLNGQYICVGGYYDPNYLYFGYIDDLRITNGLCRYPNGTTFTPPTAALPTF